MLATKSKNRATTFSEENRGREKSGQSRIVEVHSPVHAQGRHVAYVDDEEAVIVLMQRLRDRVGLRVSGYIDPRAALVSAPRRSWNSSRY